MSHTVYSTDAVVLSRVCTGEADVTVWLLTRELGIIVARAQSARKANAKMSAYLQTFACLKVSLVRGRHLWRITGTEHMSTNSDTNTLNTDALRVFARISAFIRRMTITDTQSTLDLFDTILKARQELATSGCNINTVEVITMAEILTKLGYMSMPIGVNKSIPISQLIVDVNKAIIESQM